MATAGEVLAVRTARPCGGILLALWAFARGCCWRRCPAEDVIDACLVYFIGLSLNAPACRGMSVWRWQGVVNVVLVLFVVPDERGETALISAETISAVRRGAAGRRSAMRPQIWAPEKPCCGRQIGLPAVAISVRINITGMVPFAQAACYQPERECPPATTVDRVMRNCLAPASLWWAVHRLRHHFGGVPLLRMKRVNYKAMQIICCLPIAAPSCWPAARMPH